jgi:arylsulfatase
VEDRHDASVPTARRISCWIAIIALAGGVCLSCHERPPNLVLITVDTLRADRLGAYGDPGDNSPHIDRLASDGVSFENASTCITRTTQAVASLFTGRLPAEHGLFEIGERLSDDELTLAEILHDAGYLTIGVSANPVAGPLQGLDQGFDVFVDAAQLSQRYPTRHNMSGPNPAGMGPAEAVTREAVRQISRAKDRPIFLWLLYFDPHWEYNPPAPHNQVIDWGGFDFFAEARRFRPSKSTVYFNLNGRSAEVLPMLSRLYDAEVRYTDLMIGTLIDELAVALGETLSVLTADHGESLGEHGYFYQHGALAYQPTVHIPFILHMPQKIPAAVRLSTPVSIVDLVPTVLGLLGVAVEPPPQFTGRDLRPLWENQSAVVAERLRDRIITGESGTVAHPANPIRWLGGRSRMGTRFARSDRWVLVREADSNRLYDTATDPTLQNDLAAKFPDEVAELAATLDGTPLIAGRWRSARRGRWKLIRIPEPHRLRLELYDLELDPFETKDLSAAHPEILAELADVLDATAIEAERRFADLAQSSIEIDPAVEQNLRALGYLGD